MKRLILGIGAVLLSTASFAQEDPDTTRMTFGNKEVIIISPKDAEVQIDTIDASPDEEDWEEIKAHWGGLEFGPTILLNDNMKSSFPNQPYWENDPARSFSWNLNFAEHKFKIYKNYVGVTTGLGINWTQIGLRQYRLQASDTAVIGVYDSVVTYDKNKLLGVYLTAPLMVEFCSNGDGDDDGFYLSAGVIGGVRIASSTRYYVSKDKEEYNGKTRGAFGLNAFRADAAIKLGYGDFGLFANYALIPIFDTDKTVAVHPLTLGMTLNF